MSPEQASADKNIDPRADLWSLGVVLFEMLSGRRPFPGKSPYVVIADIVSAPIPHLAAVYPEVSPELARLVARCLTRPVAERIAGAEQLLGALGPFADETAGGDDFAATRVLSRARPRAPEVPASPEPDDVEGLAPTAVIRLRSRGPILPAPAAASEPGVDRTVELPRTMRMPPVPGPEDGEPVDDDQRRTAPMAPRRPAPPVAAGSLTEPLFHAPPISRPLPVLEVPAPRASRRTLLVSVGVVVVALIVLVLGILLGRGAPAP